VKGSSAQPSERSPRGSCESSALSLHISVWLRQHGSSAELNAPKASGKIWLLAAGVRVTWLTVTTCLVCKENPGRSGHGCDGTSSFRLISVNRAGRREAAFQSAHLHRRLNRNRCRCDRVQPADLQREDHHLVLFHRPPPRTAHLAYPFRMRSSWRSMAYASVGAENEG
jgi:hypothetical protein